MIAALPLPAPLSTERVPVRLRRAEIGDLESLSQLLADDVISAGRGDRAAEGDLVVYGSAMLDVIGDPGNELIVAVDASGVIVGTFQLTRIPGLSRRGSTRLQIEAVRVSSAFRSSGIGSAMMRWVIDVAAPAAGASLVQLTSDSARPEAHRFYERLGFTGSHLGFKLPVPGV